MDKTKVRVSKSKSGFSKDNLQFRLVYKSGDGKYFKPIVLERSDALKIATHYQANKTGDPERGISHKAAKLIMTRALELGLLGNGSTESLSTIVDRPTEESEQETLPGFEPEENPPPLVPVYFPEIHFDQPFQFTEDQLADLTFIFCEVDPAQRQTSILPLKEMIDQHHCRIATETALERDHQYLIPGMHDFELKQFRESWVAFKRVQLTGQPETDMRKLMQNIDRFKVDDKGKRLQDPQHHNFLANVRDQAVPILYRTFRRHKLKVQAELERKEEAKVGSLFERLTKRISGKEEPKIAEPLAEISTRYFEQVGKLGRMLRSPLLA